MPSETRREVIPEPPCRNQKVKDTGSRTDRSGRTSSKRPVTLSCSASVRDIQPVDGSIYNRLAALTCEVSQVDCSSVYLDDHL